jgi:hypothetical protein
LIPYCSLDTIVLPDEFSLLKGFPMNRKQLIVMWIGLALMFLLGSIAPREYKDYLVWRGDNSGSRNKRTHTLVQPADLFACWIMVGAVTGGLIITLKDRHPKGDKEQ